VHLFDIDVPGKITFKESDKMSAGHQLTMFDTGESRDGLLMIQVSHVTGCWLTVFTACPTTILQIGLVHAAADCVYVHSLSSDFNILLITLVQ